MSPARIEPITVATMWHVLYPFSQQGAANSCSFIASCAYTWYFIIVWYSCTLEVQCHGKSHYYDSTVSTMIYNCITMNYTTIVVTKLLYQPNILWYYHDTFLQCFFTHYWGRQIVTMVIIMTYSLISIFLCKTRLDPNMAAAWFTKLWITLRPSKSS